MEPQQIFEKLQAEFGESVSDFTPAGEGVKDAYCKVKADKLVEVARRCKTDPELAFDFLQCVTAVDWIKEDILQVVYHLFSYSRRHSFVLKVDLPRENPVAPSVASVWKTANWQEREQFDLLGVGFEGHPDLKRLLMPDDWEGHPMRKDFKEADQYRGMPTTRYSPLELLVAYDKAHPQKEGERPGGGEAGEEGDA